MTARITEAWAVRDLPGRSRGGRQLVRTLEILEYHVGSEDSDVVICVPAGFETDFASVPRLAQGLFPALGCWGRPAIIHDYLYQTRGEASWFDDNTGKRTYLNDGRFTRLQADRIFLEAMEVVGVPAWRRTIMFRAVRLGGARGWGS